MRWIGVGVGVLMLAGCAGSGINIRVQSKGAVTLVIEQPRQTEVNPALKIKADGNTVPVSAVP